MATHPSRNALSGPGLRTGRHTCRLSDREADRWVGHMDHSSKRDIPSALTTLILNADKALDGQKTL